MNFHTELLEIGKQARAAARTLAALTTEQKNNALKISFASKAGRFCVAGCAFAQLFQQERRVSNLRTQSVKWFLGPRGLLLFCQYFQI